MIVFLLIKHEWSCKCWLRLIVSCLNNIWKELICSWSYSETRCHLRLFLHNGCVVVSSCLRCAIFQTARILLGRFTNIRRTHLVWFVEQFLWARLIDLSLQRFDTLHLFSLFMFQVVNPNPCLRLVVLLNELSLLDGVAEWGNFTKFSYSLRVQLVHTLESFWTKGFLVVSQEQTSEVFVLKEVLAQVLVLGSWKNFYSLRYFVLSRFWELSSHLQFRCQQAVWNLIFIQL